MPRRWLETHNSSETPRCLGCLPQVRSVRDPFQRPNKQLRCRSLIMGMQSAQLTQYAEALVRRHCEAPDPRGRVAMWRRHVCPHQCWIQTGRCDWASCTRAYCATASGLTHLTTQFARAEAQSPEGHAPWTSHNIGILSNKTCCSSTRSTK